jgi:hypothetical protein
MHGFLHGFYISALMNESLLFLAGSVLMAGDCHSTWFLRLGWVVCMVPSSLYGYCS